MNEDAVELVIQLVVGALTFAGVAWQTHRFRKKAAEPIAEGRCVACDGADLAVLAEGVYRCNACGYEGGPGVARNEARTRRRAIAAMDPAERHAKASGCLREALGVLQRADDNPMSLVADDRISWLHDLEGALVHARAQIERAIEYAGHPTIRTETGSFDGEGWMQRLAAEGPKLTLEEAIQPKVQRGQIRQAKRLRDDLRRALLHAVTNV